MLRVAREYVGGVSGERLSEREEFVEALSHDCSVVQVPLLASRRRTDLERLLSVFDQELRVPGDRHVLEVDEREIPEEISTRTYYRDFMKTPGYGGRSPRGGATPDPEVVRCGARHWVRRLP